MIEEHYNTIKSFFEKYGMKNCSRGIFHRTNLDAELSIGVFHPNDKNFFRGTLYIEDENKIIFRFDEKPELIRPAFCIYFNNITNIENNKKVLCIEYCAIRRVFRKFLIYVT